MNTPGEPTAPRTRKISLGVAAALLLVTAWALAIRIDRISVADGTLREDEARLVLAADGVRATGLPTMPSGKLYFRGVVSSYLTAASRALLGPSDFSARLPNAFFGAMLVPILFFFGRAVADDIAGLGLAVFVAVQPELIKWSVSAWMTSLFIVMFTAAAWVLYVGYERDRVRMQVVGAVLAVVAMLSHELGVLLAGAVVITLALRWLAGDRRWYAGRTSVIALVILAVGVVLFVVFGLQLRAATLSGAGGEFRHYFGPSLGADRFLIDLNRWRGSYLPLLIAAGIGTAMFLALRLRQAVFLFATFWVLGFVVWVVIDKQSERYGLVLLPFLGLIAVWALARMADFFSRRFRLSKAASAALWVVAIVVSFGWSVYPDVRAELARPPSESSTWLDRFHEVGARPDDLIMSDNPEIPAVYLGPVHYWVRAHNFERYSYQDGDRIRHLYTGGLRVATEDEFRQIVASLGNRTLWYVGRGGVSQISDTILAASEVVLPAVEDQPMILKIVSSVAR